MKEDGNSSRTFWSTTQVYVLSAICLLAGIGAGYVAHAPAAVPPASTTQAAPQPQMPGHSMGQISPDQMRHMADKQAEPLLAELQAKPKDADLLARIAKTYLSAHEFETAAQYYERSAGIKADPRVLTSLGGAYHFSGADDKALEAWNRALKADPNYADAMFNMGLVKWQSQSDAKGAIAIWTTMLNKNPNLPRRAYVEDLIQRAKKHIDNPGSLTQAAAK